MKFTLAFFAFLAVSGILTVNSVPVFSSRNLEEHFDDFLKLLPKQQIEDLFYDYLAEDEDFAETLDYLMSGEFISHLLEIESTSEFKNFLNYLEESGFPAYELINKLNKFLEIDPISALYRVRSNQIARGLPGFLHDLKNLLPLDDIKKLYDEKLATSEEFAQLAKNLQSKEFVTLFKKLADNYNIQSLVKKAEAKGVNFKEVLELISSVFGFQFPKPTFLVSKSLVKHVEDFIAKLPAAKLEDLFYDYLAEDEDFSATLDYLMGEEFKSQLVSIESTSEFKNFLNFFEQSGLPAYEYINKLNEFLGISHISPMIRAMPISSRITGGLPGFFKDIRALLPVDEIQKLFNEKLETAEEFAAFINKLHSEEWYGLVDKLFSNSNIQELIGKAEEKGVDFEIIFDFIASIFGFEYPPHPVMFSSNSLREDLREFLNLLPHKEIEDLFYDYLAEDEDFSETLDYLMGNEFKTYLVSIESTSEFRNVLNYLEETGIPAYEYVNKMNAFLGIDLITPLHRLMSSRISGGLPGFLQDFKALLPIDDIKKLYNEKLVSSQEFAQLVKRLHSKELYSLVEKFTTNPEVQVLLKKAEAKGVDFKAILEFIRSIFGFEFPPSRIV